MKHHENRHAAIALLVALGAACGLLRIAEDYVPGASSRYRQGINAVADPVMRAGRNVSDRINAFVDLAASHAQLLEENALLRQESAHYRSMADAFDMIHAENESLRCLLSLYRATPHTLPAHVVGRSSKDWYRYIILDRGSESGVQEGNAVIHPDGVVGQVVEVLPRACRVQLATDEYASIPVQAHQQGTHALLQGGGHFPCTLRFFRQERTSLYDAVLFTSGMAGVYPPGIRVGRVTVCDMSPMEGIVNAQVSLAVNFERMTEALIVTHIEPPPVEETSEETTDPAGDHLASR